MSPVTRPPLDVTPARSVEEVVELYRRFATDPYDEEITQLEHAEQTASLAAAEGASDELVAAALLHDVGHLFHLARNDGVFVPVDADLGHEGLGARYLARLFGPAVCAPIALHVRAKRYRCAVDPGYLSTLSSGSVRSLELQGGAADDEEIRRFEANPGSADAVRLRAWDDGGKLDGVEVTPFDDHIPLLERVAHRWAGAERTEP